MAKEVDIRKIPLTVDNAVPLLFWEPVDFIAGISIFGMGVALNLFMFGAIGCIVVLTIASKLRQGAKRGAAQHWLWSLGLTIDSALGRLNLKSWTNDFIN